MSANKSAFAFEKDNYKFMFIGMGATILGFLLMIGGASDDPNEFNADELYSHVRITLAPFLVILGYAIVIWAIMKKKKGSKSADAITPAAKSTENEAE